jgi:Na+/H+-dicarboxylate symporter
MNVKPELANFTLSLGATVNMDGVCVHLPVFAALAANLFGFELTDDEMKQISQLDRNEKHDWY